jgi:RNA recognition motif-containing protein
VSLTLNIFDRMSAGAGIGGMSALAEMFSDASRTKFERKVKPAELVPTKKLAADGDGEGGEKKEKKEKKKKWSKLAKEAAAAGAGAGPSATTEETRKGDDDINNEQTARADQQGRTLFIGNIPLSQTIKSIKQLCSEFGKVESVRLRSVPTAGTKVDEAGNQDLVRKVCANHRQFGDQKGAFNAYVVFKEAASVGQAVAGANNRVLDERHLRLDTASPSHFDPKKSVFVGSLQHYADEEELREHFANKLTNGHDDIDSVRIIRDPETLVGKGFAYVLFKSRDCVLKALELHEQPFKKRQLRVSVCGKRTKRDHSSENNKSGKKVAKSEDADDNDDEEHERVDEDDNDDDSRGRTNDREGGRKRERSQSKSAGVDKSMQDINALNASKRIKLKVMILIL